MRIILAITSLCLLAACDTNQQDANDVQQQVEADADTAASNIERHAMRIANNVRDQTKRTSMKVREWALTPLPEEIPRQLKDSYCYRILQDIVCYRQPVVGWTHKLVGYQGSTAFEPPVAQTQPVPELKAEKEIAAAMPAARLQSAKPVFVTVPPKIKENTQEALVPDVNSEPLPNPALSPQL